MMSYLKSAAIALGTTILAMAVLEILRRRGVDPVARIADVVAPPAMLAAAN